MTIYQTKEWKGFGKHEYYWNEYRLENGEVVKYRCYRIKSFNKEENEWEEGESVEESWSIDDPNMPDWLHKFL